MFKKKQTKTISDRVKELQLKNEIKESLNIAKNENVVIQKNNKIKTIISLLSNIFFFVIKGVFVLAIMILSTIGATVLLNESLRQVFFEMINLKFF